MKRAAFPIQGVALFAADLICRVTGDLAPVNVIIHRAHLLTAGYPATAPRRECPEIKVTLVSICLDQIGQIGQNLVSPPSQRPIDVM